MTSPAENPPKLRNPDQASKLPRPIHPGIVGPDAPPEQAERVQSASAGESDPDAADMNDGGGTGGDSQGNS